MVAARRDFATTRLWLTRLGQALDAGQDQEAVATIETMAHEQQPALTLAPTQWLMIFDHHMAVKKETALRRRLLAILTGPSYQAPDVVSPIDTYRHAYAQLLFDAGDKDQALALVRQIRHPDILQQLSVDPRFRSLLPADFDGRAAAQAYVDAMHALSVRHPDMLDPVLEESEWLIHLGRAQEAFDRLQSVNPLGPDGQRFVDLEDRLNWWWDKLANVHIALGHYDEAMLAFRQGGQAQENGVLNVSQMLNMSAAQLAFGHPRDTLATIDAFTAIKRGVSDYGLMVQHYNHGCALAALGEKAGIAADLDFVRAHADESREYLRDLLLCTGDIDGAAKAFIADLAVPGRRVGALLELSDYDPAPPGAGQDPSIAQREILKQRADVREAIARAGGTRRFHIQRGWD